MKKSFIKFLGAVALVAGLASSASAAYIVGDISFGAAGGNVALTGGIEGDFSDATGFDFPAGLNASVTQATGNFAPEFGAIPALKYATFFDFTFSPLPLGGAPVWTVQSGNFSFDLTSVSVTRGSNGLLLSGLGVVSSTIPGLDDTTGNFNFSVQGNNAAANFSWSSDVSSVPEGGAAIALLGLSLLGLEGARRRMKA
jgi:hypothetical protein